MDNGQPADLNEHIESAARAGRRAQELKRRAADLDAGKPSTQHDVEMAMQRARQSGEWAEAAYRRSAEAHERSAQAHERAAQAHDDAAARGGPDADEHRDAAAKHRDECDAWYHQAEQDLER